MRRRGGGFERQHAKISGRFKAVVKATFVIKQFDKYENISSSLKMQQYVLFYLMVYITSSIWL